MRRITPLLALALASPAHADTAMCIFSGGPYSIEFTGDQPGDMIYLHGSPTGVAPLSLPGTSYRLLDIDAATREVHLVFTHPGDARYPPSFTLRGRDKNVWLSTRDSRIRGELRCDWTPPGPRARTSEPLKERKTGQSAFSSTSVAGQD